MRYKVRVSCSLTELLRAINGNNLMAQTSWCCCWWLRSFWWLPFLCVVYACCSPADSKEKIDLTVGLLECSFLWQCWHNTGRGWSQLCGFLLSGRRPGGYFLALLAACFFLRTVDKLISSNCEWCMRVPVTWYGKLGVAFAFSPLLIRHTNTEEEAFSFA